MRLKRTWQVLGPGLITGASDDDPSAITTFIQAGTRYGSRILWMSFVAFPILALAQEMCARIGLVTGKGITGVVKEHYPRVVLVLLAACCVPAFLLNMGADISLLGEVIHVFFPAIAPLWGSMIFSLFLFGVMYFLSFKRLAGIMKLVALSLLVYAIVPFFTRLPLGDIIRHSLVPTIRLSRGFLWMSTALLGAILSPYLFFWQSSAEAELLESRGEKTTYSRNRLFLAMRKDILAGAFFAVLIMYFVILTAATVLSRAHPGGITTLSEAAMALAPLHINASFALFSAGLVSTFFIIIPVLSSSVSYILGEVFNLKTGFNRPRTDTRQFYGIVLLAIVVGLVIRLLQFNTMRILVITTGVYGLITPLLFLLIIHIAANRRIMGAYRSKKDMTIAALLINLLLLAPPLLLLYSLMM